MEEKNDDGDDKNVDEASRRSDALRGGRRLPGHAHHPFTKCHRTKVVHAGDKGEVENKTVDTETN